MIKKVTTAAFCIALMAMTLGSCKKEEGEKELSLDFKTGAGYTSTDVTYPTGTAFKIGVEGESEKKKDPIIKFNISESVNGGAAGSVYSQDLEDKEFSHDQNFTLSDTTHGSKHKYTFTITNRDGFNVQKDLTVTVQ